MKDIFRCLNAILDNQPSVVFAYLFGSRAKGYANDKSYWDIAVYFLEPTENLGMWPAFELEAKLSRAIDSTVQITTLNSSVSPVFGFKIVSEGILLTDKNEHLRIDFESKVLRCYYDWQYFLKRQMLAEKSVRF